MEKPIKIAITGAAGKTAYCLLYLLGKGDVFGKNQPFILQLLDLPEKMSNFETISSELLDCAFPLVRDITYSSDPDVVFNDVSAAFLIASVPSSDSMETNEAFQANVRLYRKFGESINRVARQKVKVLVIGNPANTNCLVCATYAPDIPKDNFTSLTRLDQNRAQARLASRLNVPVENVYNIIIWGDCTSTQYPDPNQGIVILQGEKSTVVNEIKNNKWLQGEFVESIQKRKRTQIKKGSMTATSIAKASAEHMRDWLRGTSSDQIVSMGVISRGEYGAPEGVIFSFPVTIKNGDWKIVEDLEWSDFATQMIEIAGNELVEKRTEAFKILKII